ncbi:hypothetical protein MMC25_005138 [Agyrium rufum]|nr:hypothetical protein [Agyrium rufum]
MVPPGNSPPSPTSSPHPEPVAVITGASSGIGLALSEHLLSKGWKVFCADINPSGAKVIASLHAPSTSKEASAPAPDTPEPVFVQCDVASFADQKRLFEQTFVWNGNVDFFAANAGIDDKEDVFRDWEGEHLARSKGQNGNDSSANREETVGNGEEEFECEEMNCRTMDVDLRAVMQGMKLFVFYARRAARRDVKEGKKKRVRRMVVTASMMGIYPFETNPQYAAAKHGLIGLVRSVGPKFQRDDNITVNAIMPAFIITGLAPKGLVETLEQKGHVTPMSSILKAYDAFIEDDSKTGETVEVSGQTLYWRKPVEFANESQRWLGEDLEGVWKGCYADARTGEKGR